MRRRHVHSASGIHSVARCPSIAFHRFYADSLIVSVTLRNQPPIEWGAGEALVIEDGQQLLMFGKCSGKFA